MSLILLIETATLSCSVALVADDAVIAVRELNQRNIHAEVITVFIDELFNCTGKQYNDLDAIAVSSGPGSYTGLRIGVSTAKGLCFALDKPLIAVETLTSMAAGLITRNEVAIEPGYLLCPMIDARRMEVYTALFDHKGHQVRATTAEIIDENSFGEYLLRHKVVFFGDGANKCHESLGLNPNAVFVNGYINSAKDMLSIAVNKLNGKTFANLAYFEPFYLKDFIAGPKSKT